MAMIQMIKPKSRSRQMRESAKQLGRYGHQRSHSKENRLQTADHRHYSNQYIGNGQPQHLPPTHHFQTVKNRQFCSTKNARKESTRIQGEQNQRCLAQGKERRPQSSKHFIGIKLKKKIQRYLLLLAVVNYSLRVGYVRAEVKRYKVFVGKGNNSKLIRSLFANRFWWQLTDDQTQAHLVWTQRAKKDIFSSMHELANQQHQLKNPLPAHRLKLKRKEKEGREAREELEALLCQKDRQTVRAECKGDNFQLELKGFLKRQQGERRSAVHVTHNHIEHHRMLTNKKNLFINLKDYCQQHNDNIFNYVPLTFHIRNNTREEYAGLMAVEDGQRARGEKGMWIVKPGENSNRGCGIQVCKKVDQVRKHIEKWLVKHPDRTFIVQKYISPFLFHRRKFDIRCFVLVTATPMVSAYFFPEGYIRTSSFEFSLRNCSNKYIHLTNDAIQKKASEYSKYQNGNKVTFSTFQQYLQAFHPHAPHFLNETLPLMRQLVLLSIRSARNFHNSVKEHTFQLLGYDFMLDEEMQPWLIEINTNPCLETNCEVLDGIIPAMLENAIKIAVDTVFKPPKIDDWSLRDLLTCSPRILQGNRFELIYSQLHHDS